MMYGLDGGKLQVLRPAADTKYPLRAGGTAAARKRKNAFPSLLYMYHYIYARSGKRKRSVRGPRETELTLRGKRRKPSPRGIGPCSAGRVTDLEKMRDKAGHVLYKMKK